MTLEKTLRSRENYLTTAEVMSLLRLRRNTRNNPLNSVDPSGHFDCDLKDAGCVAAVKANFSLRKAAFDVFNPNSFSLQRVAEALGTFGDHNGVNVSLAALKGDLSDDYAITDDKHITFNSSKLADPAEVSSTWVHEGTHVLQNSIADSMGTFRERVSGFMVGAAKLDLPDTRPSYEGQVLKETAAYTNQGFFEQAQGRKGQIYDPSDVGPGSEQRRQSRISYAAHASVNQSCGSGSVGKTFSVCQN